MAYPGGMVRSIRWGISGFLLSVAAALPFAATPAFGANPNGGIPGTTTCKQFTATKWVNPDPPHEVGKHYQVQLIGTAFTCKVADALVVKFVAEKIKPLKSMPAIGKVTGGPAGYKCTSGIANNHTAYQGNCLSLHPTPSSSSFSWGPYNDS
jgi:hypothetical protein